MWRFHTTHSQAGNTALIYMFPYLHWEAGTQQFVQLSYGLLYLTMEVEDRFEI